MFQDEEKKEEEKFEFTSEGEAVGYISLDQARVLAIEHARDNLEFYGSDYANQELVWEVLSQDESEDYYDIRLSYRPGGTFRGRPGAEQFTIDKLGEIRLRQRLQAPSRRRPRVWLPLVVGMLAVGGIVGVVFALGVFGSNILPVPQWLGAFAPSDDAKTGGVQQLTSVEIQRLIAGAMENNEGGEPSQLSEADITRLVEEVLAASQSTGDQQLTPAEAESLVQRVVAGTTVFPSATSNPTPPPSPVPTIAPTATVAPTATAVPPAPTETLTPTATPTPEPTPTLVPTARPRPTPKPTATPVPRSMVVPTPTTLPTNTPTPTTVPTPENTPLPTPTSDQLPFTGPVIFYDIDHRLRYVLDTGNHRVQVSFIGGPLLEEWGTEGAGEGQFKNPSGIIGYDGKVYVLDTGNNRVQVFTWTRQINNALTGVRFITQWGTAGAGEGQFKNASRISISNRKVYVLDTGNHRVQVFTAGGTFLGEWEAEGSGTGEFKSPRGIAHFLSRVYIADTGNHRVQVFTAGGTFLFQWGSEGTDEGQFKSPTVIKISGNTVAVTDSRAIQTFNSGGDCLQCVPSR